MISGHKNTEYEILNKLDDKSLVNYCQLNRKSRQICEDDYFWLSRIVNRFPYIDIDILRKYKHHRSWAKYYIDDLRVFKNRFNKNKNKKDNPNELLLKSGGEGRLDHIVISLNNGANINYLDYSGDTALMWASGDGHLDIVKYLIKKGANINYQGGYGWTALMEASAGDHLDIVKYLIKEGANIDLQNNNGWTALMDASSKGHLDIVKYLIENGADINIQNNSGRTALILAINYGHSKIAKFIRKKGEN